MKKGTTIKLAALLLGAALILPACTGFSNKTNSGEGSGEPTSQSSSTTEPGEQYTVAISNKDALQEEWPANGGNRKVEINVEPKANVAQLISEGKLTIESSDRAVLTIAGQMATPVAAGKATITVRSGESSDSVEVTIDPVKTNKDIYGTVHEGTADDPFDNEDAIKAAKKNIEDNLGGSFYIKGKVASFYHAPGSRTDGMVSWFLEPAEEGGAQFEVYKCMGADNKTPLTDDDIWVGGTAVAYGPFAVYNGQYETSSATFVSCEGNKPNPRTTITATFAEALAAGKELADGADTYDYYQFDAYVTKQSGKDYYLTATKGEAIEDAKTNTIELYNVADADAQAKLLKNAKVTMTMVLKNYHDQVENLFTVAADQIEVVEAGQPWVIPNHDVTVAGALEVVNGLADGATTADTYTLTDVYVKEVTGAYSADYGNMSFTVVDALEDANALTVFRAKTDAATAAKVVAGAQVTVKGNLQKYVKNDVVTPELLNVAEITVKDDGQGGGGEEQGAKLTLDAQSLLGYDGSGNVAYSTEYANSTIDGVGFTYQQIGAYKSGFAGMQFRNKLSDNANKTKSNLNNTSALPAAIESIDLKWHASKDIKTNNNVLKITFGTENTFASGTEVVMLNTVADVKDMTVTPEGKNFTFVKIEIDDSFTYTCYWDSIVLNLADEGGESQQEIAQPMGAYYGYAIALDDSNLFVDIAVANEVAFVEASSYKTVAAFTFDKFTGAFSVTTDVDELGTIDGVYDDATNTFSQLSVSGTASALLKNNGSIELNPVAHLYELDGSTEELQAQFVRRYRTTSSNWSVDTGNADRLTRDEEHFVAGTGAMKVRPYSGNVWGISLAADFETAEAHKNIGFWVYNGGEADITFRTWVYTSKGLSGAAEIGSMTAKAGQWTYCRMGFNSTIYNFNISNWNGNANALVFDNIALF